MITNIPLVAALVVSITLGLALSYFDDFKYFGDALTSFTQSFDRQSNRCKGNTFGDNCQHCGLASPIDGCYPDLKKDWIHRYECAKNETHTFMGARCTYLCQTFNCTAVDPRRCFTDTTQAKCHDVSLYKQRFIRTSEHSNRRRLLSSTAGTAGTAGTVPTTQWSLTMNHGLTCNVRDCGENPCTHIIWGSGVPDVIMDDWIIPMNDTLTCECGPHVHHRLYVTPKSSCDMYTVREPRVKISRTAQRAQRNEICLPASLNNGKCTCPIGHYMVGDFFCAEQFDLFVHDRIVSIEYNP